jgi:hypothetical protein
MALRNLRHHLNALHVLARLVQLGIPRSTALVLASAWEQCIHPLLYPTFFGLTQVRVATPVRIDLRPRRRY